MLCGAFAELKRASGTAKSFAVLAVALARGNQKILANPGIDPLSPLYPLAHLGLARAYAMENNQAASRREYEKFFDMWKNADADVPVLKQARAEYSRLKVS